jgi:hypothetical protein
METEGVGFEPTVGFPTLDFESSALNRTQPPFLQALKKTPNAQRPTSNIDCNCLPNWAFSVGCWTFVFRLVRGTAAQGPCRGFVNRERAR